jgi:hypothetical protein
MLASIMMTYRKVRGQRTVQTGVLYQGNPSTVNTVSDEQSKRGSHKEAKLHPNSRSLLRAQISS